MQPKQDCGQDAAISSRSFSSASPATTAAEKIDYSSIDFELQRI